AWRLKILRWAADEPRQVARTCRHFGISRTAFYRWKRRFEVHGEAGQGDRPRTPQSSPRATPREVVSKILYLTRVSVQDGVASALRPHTPEAPASTARAPSKPSPSRKPRSPRCRLRTLSRRRRPRASAPCGWQPGR